MGQRDIPGGQQLPVPSKGTPRRGLSSTCGNRQLQHVRHLVSPRVPVLSALILFYCCFLKYL